MKYITDLLTKNNIKKRLRRGGGLLLWPLLLVLQTTVAPTTGTTDLRYYRASTYPPLEM